MQSAHIFALSKCILIASNNKKRVEEERSVDFHDMKHKKSSIKKSKNSVNNKKEKGEQTKDLCTDGWWLSRHNFFLFEKGESSDILKFTQGSIYLNDWRARFEGFSVAKASKSLNKSRLHIFQINFQLKMPQNHLFHPKNHLNWLVN